MHQNSQTGSPSLCQPVPHDSLFQVCALVKNSCVLQFIQGFYCALYAGDIGGTNSRFQLWTAPSQNSKTLSDDTEERHTIPGQMLYRKAYANEQFELFEDVLQTFFTEAADACDTIEKTNDNSTMLLDVDVICLAVAG